MTYQSVIVYYDIQYFIVTFLSTLFIFQITYNQYDREQVIDVCGEQFVLDKSIVNQLQLDYLLKQKPISLSTDYYQQETICLIPFDMLQRIYDINPQDQLKISLRTTNPNDTYIPIIQSKTDQCKSYLNLLSHTDQTYCTQDSPCYRKTRQILTKNLFETLDEKQYELKLQYFREIYQKISQFKSKSGQLKCALYILFLEQPQFIIAFEQQLQLYPDQCKYYIQSDFKLNSGFLCHEKEFSSYYIYKYYYESQMFVTQLYDNIYTHYFKMTYSRSQYYLEDFETSFVLIDIKLSDNQYMCIFRSKQYEVNVQLLYYEYALAQFSSFKLYQVQLKLLKAAKIQSQQRKQQQSRDQQKQRLQHPLTVNRFIQQSNDYYKKIVLRVQEKGAKNHKNILIQANLINTNVIFDLDWFYQFVTDFSQEFLLKLDFYLEELQQRAGYGLEFNLIKQPYQLLINNVEGLICQNLPETDTSLKSFPLNSRIGLPTIEDKYLFDYFKELVLQNDKVYKLKELLEKCIFQNKLNCLKLKSKEKVIQNNDSLIFNSVQAQRHLQETIQSECQVTRDIESLTKKKYEILLDQSLNCNEIPNENIFNLSVLCIKIINFYQKCSQQFQTAVRKHYIDLSFSGFYRSFNFNEKCNKIINYEDEYDSIQKWKNSFTVDKLIKLKDSDQVKYLDSLSQPYNFDRIAVNILQQSMTDCQFRLNSDNYFGQLPLSSFYNDLYKSPILVQNLIDQTVQQEIQASQRLRLEELENYEQADLLTCKDDSKIVGLKQYLKSYKFTPQDQYNKYKLQNPDRFDTGVYQNDAYKKQPEPRTFKETMQMANSVLNRGELFIIPFMSAANQVQAIQQKEEEPSTTAEDSKTTTTQLYTSEKRTQGLIQNNYMKFGGLSGCEGQIIHIEEEEQCFCLFKQRSNVLLKIFVEWMAVYEPQMLTFFDFSTSRDQAQGSGDVTLGNQYRRRMAKLNGSYSQHFDQLDVDKGEQDYIHFQETQSDKSSNQSDIYDNVAEQQIADYPWSQKFDNDLLNIYQQYKQMVKLDKLRPNTADSYADGCIAPLAVLPFPDSLKNMPPPPYIPVVLQVFLTQFYTCGDILTQINQNPIIAIPIVTRTLSQYLSQLRQAEQRSDFAHRNIFGNFLYRSYDFKQTYLNDIERKYNNQKQILQDVQRRVQDWHNAIDPSQFDCCCDFNLPKEYQLIQNSFSEKSRQTEDVQPIKLSPIALYQLTDYTLDVRQTSINKLLFKKLSQMVFVDADIYNSQDELDAYENIDIQFTNDDYLLFECLQNNANFSILQSQDKLKQYQRHYISTISNADLSNQQMQIPDQYALNVYSNECIMLQQFMKEIEQLNLNILGTDVIRYKPEEGQPPKLYTQQYYTSLLSLVKSLKCEQDRSKLIKKTLERCYNENILLQSLVDGDIKVQNNTITKIPAFKSTNYFYSQYSQLQLPTCTARSLLLTRMCLFQIKISDDEFNRIINKKFTAFNALHYANQQFIQEKNQALKEIKQKNQKSTQVTLFQQLQQECAKKHIYQQIIMPLLLQYDDKVIVRLIDDDIYCLLRQTVMIATRIEYCLRVIENLNHYERQEARYGTRSMDPIPLCWLNQQNIGVSVFGNDQILDTYEKLTSKFNKYALQSLPLYVSTRVMKGVLSSSLLNLTQKSLAPCNCGLLFCPFCGGIGAGLNDSISGNVKLDSRYIRSNDYQQMGSESVNGAIEQHKEKLQPIVDVSSKKIIKINKKVFQDQDENINLIYFLKPSIGSICREGTYQLMLTKLQASQKHIQIQFQQQIEEKLQKIEKQYNRICIYSRYNGMRLQDTALMLPRPDQYSLNYFQQHLDNPFVKEYIEMTQSLKYPLMKEINNTLCQQKFYNINNSNDKKITYDDRDISYETNNVLIPHLISNNPLSNSPDIDIDQLENNIKIFHNLLEYLFPNQKETYMLDQIYGLFGLYGYVFISLKKLFQHVGKKIETMAQKLLNYHADLIQLTYYRNQKTTIENSTQVSLILYDIYSQINNVCGEYQIKLSNTFVNILKTTEQNIYWCKKTGKSNIVEMQQIDLEIQK